MLRESCCEASAVLVVGGTGIVHVGGRNTELDTELDTATVTGTDTGTDTGQEKQPRELQCCNMEMAEGLMRFAVGRRGARW